MKLIVGLGNIGKEYSQTRHNVGFMVADKIAGKFCCTFGKEERHALTAEFRLDGEKILILKPTTYMNESGQAVGEYARFYGIAPEDIAVIHDDMDLELGQLRIRKKGSSGGHNGIKSIQSHLGTDAFPRFRIGIGHPQHDREIVIDHVLTKFSPKEKEIMEPAIESMAMAAETWLTEDIDSVMNKFNTKKTKKEEEKSPIDQTKHKDACD
ncbi:MAG: aminoacyl-tRNA hydrolase [Acidaminococcaceae bacterium]|nr:aminoacyl-tRNA hydrolase [Acidaminococcaceae bacterium]